MNNSFSLKIKDLNACWWIFIGQPCAMWAPFLSKKMSEKPLKASKILQPIWKNVILRQNWMVHPDHDSSTHYVQNSCLDSWFGTATRFYTGSIRQLYIYIYNGEYFEPTVSVNEWERIWEQVYLLTQVWSGDWKGKTFRLEDQSGVDHDQWGGWSKPDTSCKDCTKVDR